MFRSARGYSPREGDQFVGELSGDGCKDEFYLRSKRQGRVYVDDYLLSASSAAQG